MEQSEIQVLAEDVYRKVINDECREVLSQRQMVTQLKSLLRHHIKQCGYDDVYFTEPLAQAIQKLESEWHYIKFDTHIEGGEVVDAFKAEDQEKPPVGQLIWVYDEDHKSVLLGLYDHIGSFLTYSFKYNRWGDDNSVTAWRLCNPDSPDEARLKEYPYWRECAQYKLSDWEPVISGEINPAPRNVSQKVCE